MRGDLDFDSMRVHISGDDIDMVEELTKALTARGATITDAAKGATAIKLQTSRFNRATLTTDARGRANAHQLRFEVEFTVAAGEETTAHTIAIARVLNYHPAKQLQSEHETRFLESTMRSDAATRIMQILSRR